MRMNEITDFLLRAKRATYAGKGAESTPSRPRSKDLLYAEGDLMYIDTYLGDGRFAGTEALWRGHVPFWSMNYCGRVLADGFDGDFLKEALSLCEPEQPYRGPGRYTRDDFTYLVTSQGTMDWFSGVEEIFKGSQKVYECVFHGGAIG